MVNFNFDKLRVETKQFGHSVNVNNRHQQTFPKGLYLGSDQDFLDYYRDCPDPDERLQDVCLTYEYEASDLTQGDGSPDQELIVSKATLVDAQFDNEDMQREWGFLLEHELAKKGRERMLGDTVPLSHDGGFIIRAQDSKMDYILDLDYCYQHSGFGLSPTAIARVIHDMEEGNADSSQSARIIRKGIEHAVAMAITSGLPKRLMLYRVNNNELFNASNAGEKMYRGRPKKGTLLCEVSPEGIITPALKSDREKISERSYDL